MGLELRHIEFILYVKDQDTSSRFYENVLGIVPKLEVTGMTEFKLDENCTLGLMPESGIARILGDSLPHPDSGNGIPRCELYLYVDDPVSSLETALRYGAHPVSGVGERNWGDLAGYVSDPDGHVIAFAKKQSDR